VKWGAPLKSLYISISKNDKSFPIPHPKAFEIASFEAQYPAIESIF